MRNNSGTISAFTITNLTVNGASLGDGALIDLQAGGSANATINVTSSTFTNAFSEGLQVNNEGSGTAAVRVSSSTFTNNNIGVNLSTNYNAVLNYNISGNTFTNARQAVNVSNVAAAPGAPYMEGSISNNQISATNSAAIALWVVQEGNGQITTKIENNTKNFRLVTILPVMDALGMKVRLSVEYENEENTVLSSYLHDQ